MHLFWIAPLRAITTILGAVLVGAGLAGLAILGFGPRYGLQLEATRLAARLGLIAVPAAPGAVPLSADEVAQLLPTYAAAAAAPTSVPAGVPAGVPAPPSRVRLPRIDLDAEVVPAQLVRVADVITWEVPAHRVGHAQGTAGAGAAGNMLLFGHVSSLNAGNVFASLDRVAAGDEVFVTGGPGSSFAYRVTEVRRVARDDTSVLAASDLPTVTLITCTGTWLPDQRDYSHRLAVRAVLAPPASPASPG